MSTKPKTLTGSKFQWSTAIPYFVLLALVVIMGLLKPATISLNYLNIKGELSLPLIIIAVGQTIVLISQGMDLSVGGVMSLTTCLMATISESSIVGAIAVCLLIGLGTGALNGFLISKFRLQPFVATLGTWTVMGGFALSILKSDGGVIDPNLSSVLVSKIGGKGGVSMTLVLIAVIIAVWFIIKNTSFGYSIYAIGSNERAAYFNGVSVMWTKIKVYMTSGACAALGGIFYAGINRTGSPTVGEANIMMSVAAAVIGGTALSGGKGGVVGTIVGVFILKIISDILVFAGITSYYTSLFQGVLMIGAVAMGSISTIMKEKRGLEYG